MIFIPKYWNIITKPKAKCIIQFSYCYNVFTKDNSILMWHFCSSFSWIQQNLAFQIVCCRGKKYHKNSKEFWVHERLYQMWICLHGLYIWICITTLLLQWTPAKIRCHILEIRCCNIVRCLKILALQIL